MNTVSILHFTMDTDGITRWQPDDISMGDVGECSGGQGGAGVPAGAGDTWRIAPHSPVPLLRLWCRTNATLPPNRRRYRSWPPRSPHHQRLWSAASMRHARRQLGPRTPPRVVPGRRGNRLSDFGEFPI